MKTITFLLLFNLAANSLHGQNIPNPGFENWTSSGGSEILDGWEATIAGYSSNFFKTTNSRSGQFALTMKVTGDTSGNVSICQQPYLISGLNLNDPGFPYIGRPAGLSGYYKFSPVSNDTFSIDLGLYDSDSLLGAGLLNSTIATGDNWKYFEIPILYVLNGMSSSVIITASPSTSESEICNIGTYLVLDDLKFVNVISGSNEEIGSKELLIYPNPTSNGSFNISGRGINKVQVLNLFGQTIETLVNIKSDQNVESVFEINLKEHASGIYFLMIQRENHLIVEKIIYQSK